MATCDYCLGEIFKTKTCNWSKVVGVEYPDGIKSKAIRSSQNCPICGVSKGGYHHPNCEMEKCPRCKKYLLSCGCLG